MMITTSISYKVCFYRFYLNYSKNIIPYLLHNLFISINIICLYLGMCKFEAIPSSSCPSSSDLNDNNVPACTTKRYHSVTSFCEGNYGVTPGTSNINNCGDWDVYKCIRGNQTNSNHMIIEII